MINSIPIPKLYSAKGDLGLVWEHIFKCSGQLTG
uniref:Uncharacterized protein n=1 Tax=Anguilla anguilla TaxID=7936 RepID=A0A0E9TKY2_ANGAN